MITSMRVCTHCQAPYQWEKSQSALRFTYCGVLCERGGLGFSIDGLIRAEITRAPEPVRVARGLVGALPANAFPPLIAA